MVENKSGQKVNAPLFEFVESEKSSEDNAVYFRGKKLKGKVRFCKDFIEYHAGKVDPSEFLDFDAEDFPDNTEITLESNSQLSNNISGLSFLMRNGPDLVIVLNCGFFGKDVSELNLNPLKIVMNAKEEARKKGYNSLMDNSGINDEVCFEYEYLVPAKGNVFVLYKNALVFGEDLIEDAIRKVAKAAAEEKY